MKRSQATIERYEEAQKGERRFYCREGGVQEVMTTVLIAVMLCQSIIRCYSVYGGGGGSRLQVDELVHQLQRAGQAGGQAGFRAATVTARVAS